MAIVDQRNARHRRPSAVCATITAPSCSSRDGLPLMSASATATIGRPRRHDSSNDTPTRGDHHRRRRKARVPDRRAPDLSHAARHVRRPPRPTTSRISTRPAPLLSSHLRVCPRCTHRHLPRRAAPIVTTTRATGLVYGRFDRVAMGLDTSAYAAREHAPARRCAARRAGRRVDDDIDRETRSRSSTAPTTRPARSAAVGSKSIEYDERRRRPPSRSRPTRRAPQSIRGSSTLLRALIRRRDQADARPLSKTNKDFLEALPVATFGDVVSAVRAADHGRIVVFPACPRSGVSSSMSTAAVRPPARRSVWGRCRDLGA